VSASISSMTTTTRWLRRAIISSRFANLLIFLESIGIYVLNVMRVGWKFTCCFHLLYCV